MSSATRRLVTSSLALLLLGGAACAPPEEEEGALENASQPLNGTPIFDDHSCDLVQGKITQATSLAATILGKSAMVDCMRQAIFSYSDTAFAEFLLYQLRANMPTHYGCGMTVDPGALAQSAPGTPNEGMTFNLGWILRADTTPAVIAPVILHEVSHNKGYLHASTDNNSSTLLYQNAFEYPYSVPAQVYQCAASVQAGASPPQPNGPRRDSTALEATLQPVGQYGGGPFETACPSGDIAFGVQARTDIFLNNVALSCRVPNSSNYVSTVAAGGNGGNPSSLLCGAGQVMVGVFGRAADIHTNIGPLCAAETDVRAGRVAVTQGPSAGGIGGFTYQRLCPPAMVVRALKGRSGELIDRIEVECQSINRVESIRETTLAAAGGGGGVPGFERCPGRAAMVGLSLQTWDRVNRAGGICAQVNTSCFSGLCVDGVGSATHLMPTHGGTGGQVAQYQCPSGSVLVGLQLRSGAKIDAIGGICAEAVKWSWASSATTTTNSPMFGGGGGSPTTRMCPGGQFLVGWNLRHGERVDNIQPICRDFR